MSRAGRGRERGPWVSKIVPVEGSADTVDVSVVRPDGTVMVIETKYSAVPTFDAMLLSVTSGAEYKARMDRLADDLMAVGSAHIICDGADPSAVPDGDSPHEDIVYDHDSDADEIVPSAPSAPPSRAMQRAMRRAAGALSLMELILPTRLCQEDLGDALEKLSRPQVQQGPAWRVYLVAIASMFWLAISGVREVASSVLGKKAGS